MGKFVRGQREKWRECLITQELLFEDKTRIKEEKDNLVSDQFWWTKRRGWAFALLTYMAK